MSRRRRNPNSQRRTRHNRQPGHVALPRAVRLFLEPLEPRIVLSTWSGDIYDGLGGATGPLFTNTSVQEIVGNVHVPAGKTLTVQAGAVVKFDNGTSLTVDGTLVAQGTASQTIYFTSINDNSPENGSNTAGPGNWQDIVFNSDSTGNTISNAVIRYAGSNGTPAEVYDHGAPLTLTSSAISNSGSPGLRLEQTTATLSADTFSSNNGAAISMDLDSNPTITGESASDFTGNIVNGLALDGGNLAENLTWNNPSIVYVVQHAITVPAGMTLTVGAGQIVKVLGISLTVDGTLSAQGTAASPVIFTSLNDNVTGGQTSNNANANPGQGNWGMVQFDADSTANVLTYVQVLYAGSNGTPAAVYDQGGPLTMSNSTVSTSGSSGLRLEKSTASLSADTFTSNNGAAISMDLDSNPTIIGEAAAEFHRQHRQRPGARRRQPGRESDLGQSRHRLHRSEQHYRTVRPDADHRRRADREAVRQQPDGGRHAQRPGDGNGAGDLHIIPQQQHQPAAGRLGHDPARRR